MVSGISPNVWKDIVENGNCCCLCTGNGENDFRLIRGEEDIKAIADTTRNVFVRLSKTPQMDIIETIKSLFSSKKIKVGDIVVEEAYPYRDVHLMLLVHMTPDADLNSMFDKVFHADSNDFSL